MKKHPDIRMEQLVNLMLCRGDMSRSEARQVGEQLVMCFFVFFRF